MELKKPSVSLVTILIILTLGLSFPTRVLAQESTTDVPDPNSRLFGFQMALFRLNQNFQQFITRSEEKKAELELKFANQEEALSKKIETSENPEKFTQILDNLKQKHQQRLDKVDQLVEKANQRIESFSDRKEGSEAGKLKLEQLKEEVEKRREEFKEKTEKTENESEDQRQLNTPPGQVRTLENQPGQSEQRRENRQENRQERREDRQENRQENRQERQEVREEKRDERTGNEEVRGTSTDINLWEKIKTWLNL